MGKNVAWSKSLKLKNSRRAFKLRAWGMEAMEKERRKRWIWDRWMRGILLIET